MTGFVVFPAPPATVAQSSSFTARPSLVHAFLERPRTKHQAPLTPNTFMARTVAGFVAASAVVTMTLHSPALAQEAPPRPGQSIASCPPRASCVSTSSVRAPRSFMPPWLFEPNSQDKAFRQLLEQLEGLGAQITQVDEQLGLVTARVPYGKLGTEEDVEDMQFLFKEGRFALFRSESSISLPDPPFCFRPGCINGPRNRERMENLRDSLGWTNMETDEDKIWQQVMFH